MKDEVAEKTIGELKTAIAELESADGLESFVEGHGLQSRYFAFHWDAGGLSIDFRLPYARVLSDEESQAEDVASVGGALRLAILLIAANDEGRLLSDGEASLSVSADEFGRRYSIADADGETLDSADDWDSLIARLGAMFPDESEGLQIIWP